MSELLLAREVLLDNSTAMIAVDMAKEIVVASVEKNLAHQKQSTAAANQSERVLRLCTSPIRKHQHSVRLLGVFSAGISIFASQILPLLGKSGGLVEPLGSAGLEMMTALPMLLAASSGLSI